MNKAHAGFDPEAFLMPFKDRHEILEAYLDTVPKKMLSLDRPLLSWEVLRDHLLHCPPDESRSILAGFREAYELCSDDGHVQLLKACQKEGGFPRDILDLPVECLAIMVLTDNRELFETALSLNQVMSSDALELFKPEKKVTLVGNISLGMGHFRAEMAILYGSNYGSERILMKHFHEGNTLTVGFYFEKSPKAQRLLDGSAEAPHLKHEEVRLLQLDFVVFDESTGILSVKSAWSRHTKEICKAFGVAFLQDENAYMWKDSGEILDLQPLIDVDGDFITELIYGFPDDNLESRYHIRALNVMELLVRDNLLGRVEAANVMKAVVQMPIQGKTRKRRVVLQMPNKIEFKRTGDALAILKQLHDRNVFTAPISD